MVSFRTYFIFKSHLGLNKSAMILLLSLVSIVSHAQKMEKGLLPEFQDKGEEQTISSEVLISRTESKAIESLQALLKKKKGSPEEADMWYRLAELYMRKSKSERFFDLFMNKENKLSIFPNADKKGLDWVKKASDIYTKIEFEFKNFKDMDSVLFNNAFANQQLGKFKESQNLYIKLIEKHPKSLLLTDALVAVAELFYDQRKFAMALNYYEQLEKYPDSKVYPYSMYKMAWTHYNLRNSSNAINKLLQVVNLNPPNQESKSKQNLRREALRDLTIFIGDFYAADQLYSFFAKITTEEELGLAISDLAKLYESHSRQKEMNIFLDEFIKKQADNPYLVKAHLYLVDANELLKKRPDVVKHLQIANELCTLNSTWRLKQKKEIPDESCTQDFHRTSYDIAEKWWEIWIKNKQHKEFSELTEKALRIILTNEDAQKPDLKMHYAFAELLFNLNKFDEASEQYKFVAEKIDDKKIQHDATYSALFSKEKSIEQTMAQGKSPLKEGQRKDLAFAYVQKFPQGIHIDDVTFKIALIYYEEANYNESEKWLVNFKSGLMKAKAEDLQLDIYNIKKDYTKIHLLAKKILSQPISKERQQSIQKIQQEADYADIQSLIKNNEKIIAAERLTQFAKDYPKSPLAVDALWQSLSLYFAEDWLLKGAETSLLFQKMYPQDKRSLEILKDAAKAFAETGNLKKSADTWKLISDLDKKEKDNHLELAADFYALEKKTSEARKIYNQILTQANSQTRSRIFSKLLLTYDRANDGKEYQKIQGIILNLNIEPFSSQILLDKAKNLVTLKKYGEAFELARKIMSRETAADIRSQARLIQAQILEDELVRQSVKSTKEDRFAVVIALKAEKLEKALTAYIGASKLSPDVKTQMEAFSGVDRCYSNFIDSLKDISFPESISETDQKTLKKEIAGILEPMMDKKKENQKQVQKLAKARVLNDRKQDYAEIPIDKHLAPVPHYPSFQSIAVYWPSSEELIFSKMKRFEESKNPRCSDEIKSFDDAGNCFFAKKFESVEKWAAAKAENKKTQIHGIYFLSLVAEAKGYPEKSLWLSDLALKLRPDTPLFTYQKARMIFRLENMQSALPVFDKVLDMQMTSTEMETFLGIKAYVEKDFDTANFKFSRLSTDQLYSFDVGLLLSETFAQKGEPERALEIVSRLISYKNNVAEFHLQKGQILEFYKMTPALAVDSYETAKKLTTDADLKDWLDKKIEFIKSKLQSRAAR